VRGYSTLVKRLADDSKDITFINDCAGGEWEEATNYRQMMECMRNGEILTDPKWDDESQTHQFRMGYFHAGQDIIIDIAIKNKQHLYVLNVCQ